jgi:hypothetical protein
MFIWPTATDVQGEQLELRLLQGARAVHPGLRQMDPNQFPQCQHLVWVKASISGAYPSSRLDVDISYPGLQHRTTFALTNFFNGLANQAQQQQLKKAQQTALPKL